MPARSTSTRTAYLTGTAVLLLAGGILAACSASTSGSGSAPGSTSPAAQQSPASGSGFGGGGSGNGANRRGPAASGTIAAVAPASIEVQNPSSGQTTVDYSSKTRFTQTVRTSLSAVKAGTCIVARAASSSSTTDPDPSSITASTVVITAGRGTDCFGRGSGFGFRGGSGGPRQVPSGSLPSGRRFPSGFPTGARPSGAPGTRSGLAATVFGKVTAVHGTTITVSAASFARGSSSASASPAPKTVQKRVTVMSSTIYTETVSATKSALEVGRCATAEGATNSTGAVSARSIAVTDPVNGQCLTGGGFGGFGFGGFGPGAGGRSGAAGAPGAGGVAPSGGATS